MYGEVYKIDLLTKSVSRKKRKGGLSYVRFFLEGIFDDR